MPIQLIILTNSVEKNIFLFPTNFSSKQLYLEYLFFLIVLSLKLFYINALILILIYILVCKLQESKIYFPAGLYFILIHPHKHTLTYSFMY
jgi:hypothetical protein